MSNHKQYRDYPLVDATVGTRLILGFSVALEPLRRRVPQPFVPSPAPPRAYVAAQGSNTWALQKDPNLLVVFNDLLLNQDENGQTQADASARYVGFSIPSKNTLTDEKGMVHFRIFTNNPKAVPGRYRDSLPARVRRQTRTVGERVSATVHDHWELEPEDGGLILSWRTNVARSHA